MALWYLEIQETDLHRIFAMELEFTTLPIVGKEAQWLRNSLYKIFYGLNQCMQYLYYESEAILSQAYNGICNGKFRHFSLRDSLKIKYVSIERIFR